MKCVHQYIRVVHELNHIHNKTLKRLPYASYTVTRVPVCNLQVFRHTYNDGSMILDVTLCAVTLHRDHNS